MARHLSHSDRLARSFAHDYTIGIKYGTGRTWAALPASRQESIGEVTPFSLEAIRPVPISAYRWTGRLSSGD